MLKYKRFSKWTERFSLRRVCEGIPYLVCIFALEFLTFRGWEWKDEEEIISNKGCSVKRRYSIPDGPVQTRHWFFSFSCAHRRASQLWNPMFHA